MEWLIEEIIKNKLKSRIIFEMTEREPLDYNSLENINKLTENGFKIAIDDFGTGFTSFGQLFSLDNIDYVKIDKIYIQNLH